MATQLKVPLAFDPDAAWRAVLARDKGADGRFVTGVLTTEARPLAHRIVSLYRYDATTKKWVRVAVELTGPRGAVRFVREPSATGTFELVYSGTPTLTAAHSGQATVTVAD